MLLFTVWWLVYASPVIFAVQRAKELGDGKGRTHPRIKACFLLIPRFIRRAPLSQTARERERQA